MRHQLSEDDLDFLGSFNRCELAPGGFHHREHVRLAYIFLVRHGVDEAPVEFRAALQRFLSHYRIDPSKYHETMTVAWVLAVWHFMQSGDACADSDAFMAANPILGNSKIMLTHYSRELIDSERARRRFVEPDLDPIPRPH